MRQIEIPNVQRDERIERTINALFKVINETECAHSDNSVVWDFSRCGFLHPFFLAPLAIYLDSSDQAIHCQQIPKILQRYFEAVHFQQPLSISTTADLVSLEPYSRKTYTPICRFEMANESVVDNIQSVIQQIIEQQSQADRRIKTPLAYFLGELICNISQHAQSKFGYIYSQYLRQEQCIDICIADSGITVYGSYIRANKYLERIEDNEAKALRFATEGYSSKNLPNAENRGYGISSSKQMLVEGLNGGFFMLSGTAFHRHISTENDFIQLPDSFRWNGTIILMRIPVNVPPCFDYSKYIN